MSRDRARYLGGLASCVLCGLLTLGLLVHFAPPRNVGEQGPQRWLIVGGGCVLPAALFYGWFLGMFVVGKVWR